jgi:hypothetical protein
MKQIALPNKELRLLSGQLQNFQSGYTVEQIRSLDKVVRVMEEAIKEYVDGIGNIVKGPIAFSTPEEKAKLEKEQDEQLMEYIKTEGNKVVSISLEDTDLDFVKSVWAKMGALSGAKEAREAIIKIDDAIKEAKEPVFTDGKVESKLPN